MKLFKVQITKTGMWLGTLEAYNTWNEYVYANSHYEAANFVRKDYSDFNYVTGCPSEKLNPKSEIIVTQLGKPRKTGIAVDKGSKVYIVQNNKHRSLKHVDRYVVNTVIRGK